jgi:hypothetical protein
MSQPLLICGRRLKNYTELNHDVEAGFTVELCIACEVGVTLSPEAQAKLATARKDPHFHPVGAICTQCAMLLVPPGSDIRQTNFGREQEERNPAKPVTDFMRRKAMKPR